MIMLALALAGPPAPPAPPDPQPWRLVSEAGLHVGARPAALVSVDEVGVGLTIQVSVFAP